MVLQSIRDRLTGIIAVFIFAILIIPFAFVGVSSYFTSDAVNAVAVVNDQEITSAEFNQGFVQGSAGRDGWVNETVGDKQDFFHALGP